VGRYLGREQRYSRQEIEAQAKRAIEARVGLGRPPAEDWRPLDARLAEIDGQPVAWSAPGAAPQPHADPVPATAPAPL